MNEATRPCACALRKANPGPWREERGADGMKMLYGGTQAVLKFRPATRPLFLVSRDQLKRRLFLAVFTRSAEEEENSGNSMRLRGCRQAQPFSNLTLVI